MCRCLLLSCKGYNWLLSLWSLIKHIHCHEMWINRVMTFNPVPVCPHLKHCLVILTTEYVGIETVFDPRQKQQKKGKKYELSTLTTPTTPMSFYQFIGDIINGPVWQNINPVLKLWPCRTALLLLIKRWRFCSTCPKVSNEGYSSCRQKLPYTDSLVSITSVSSL